MTTPHLHGNHDPCPACVGTGRAKTAAFLANEFETANGKRFPKTDVFLNCPTCKGTGRSALPRAEIVRRACIEARRLYWPPLEERIAHG